QFDQQKDSARYLAELNAWLESFVNGGISQIQGLAANVQQISEQLGLETTPDQAGAPNSGQPNPVIARVQGQAAIQASLDGLSALMLRDLAGGECTPSARCHHADHLATELKAEIKGERLRFVDAMKEATAINVGIHVEQFKKELTREVLSMTQEVNRLQTERQALEQQIAELFAFYARRQQAGAVTGVRTCPQRLCPGHIERRT
ncbi:hypothetical protein PUNSTDRAFT_61956, partial [Punctularia strigosozonata HHB-11173 SS5]|uniref:uncharacterized protein n=1 Tax=Punctularia strigosozonata (strain HHB-11173) TaxID=741275 RepID=UPI0004418156